jgi:hypothetical protein
MAFLLKVVRIAPQDAASIGALMITAESGVAAEAPKKLAVTGPRPRRQGGMTWWPRLNPGRFDPTPSHGSG